MPKPDCCNQNCNQSRTCPVRLEQARQAQRNIDRRKGSTWAWLLFGWVLFGERRSGLDRRQRQIDTYTGKTLFGIPIVIDDTVPPGKAEFRSGRRTVEMDIKPTGEEK